MLILEQDLAKTLIDALLNLQPDTGREKTSRQLLFLFDFTEWFQGVFQSLAAVTPIFSPTVTAMDRYWSADCDWFRDHATSARHTDRDESKRNVTKKPDHLVLLYEW